MKKGNNTISVIKSIILTVFFVFFGLQSYASVYSLSAIEVNKNESGQYSVILKTDKRISVKKEESVNGKLTLLLGSTLPSDSTDIIYDNSPEISNIVVQKKNKNSTLVLFEGAGINNAQIYIRDLSSGIVYKTDNGKFLNKKIKTGSALFGVLLSILYLFALKKNKNKKYVASGNYIGRKQKRSVSVNTLRNKNLVQSKNIPSISSKVSGSFNSAKVYMSIPSELAVNESFEQEQIRKAG